MITSGALLIEREAQRPRCFEVEADAHANGWTLVRQRLTPQQLEKELSASGWTFFFMAGPIRATAFGFNRDKAIYAALKRGINAVIEQRCNCLQIESVETHSRLGIPYVTLSIRPRHIQKGTLFPALPLAPGADISERELHRDPVAT